MTVTKRQFKPVKSFTCPMCQEKFLGPTKESAIVQYEEHLPCSKEKS